MRGEWGAEGQLLTGGIGASPPGWSPRAVGKFTPKPEDVGEGTELPNGEGETLLLFEVSLRLRVMTISL